MLEFLAPIYEGNLWHSFILKTLASARSSSLDSIFSFVSNTLEGITGTVLDVACGPATYGRRIASHNRNVYGVDYDYIELLEMDGLLQCSDACFLWRIIYGSHLYTPRWKV